MSRSQNHEHSASSESRDSYTLQKRAAAAVLTLATLVGVGGCASKEAPEKPAATTSVIPSPDVAHNYTPTITPVPRSVESQPLPTIDAKSQEFLNDPSQPSDFYKLPDEQKVRDIFWLQNEAFNKGTSYDDSLLNSPYMKPFANGKTPSNYMLSFANFERGNLPNVNSQGGELLNYMIAQEAIAKTAEFPATLHDGGSSPYNKVVGIDTLAASQEYDGKNLSPYLQITFNSLNQMKNSAALQFSDPKVLEDQPAKSSVVDGKKVMTKTVTYSLDFGDRTATFIDKFRWLPISLDGVTNNADTFGVWVVTEEQDLSTTGVKY